MLEFSNESRGVRGLGPQVFFLFEGVHLIKGGTCTLTMPSAPATSCKGRTEAELGHLDWLSKGYWAAKAYTLRSL